MVRSLHQPRVLIDVRSAGQVLDVTVANEAAGRSLKLYSSAAAAPSRDIPVDTKQQVKVFFILFYTVHLFPPPYPIFNHFPLNLLCYLSFIPYNSHAGNITQIQT